MPFASGDRVGPYEILAPIGAGGMGEVWKARDPRLNRVVAIKTSQEKFSERFEREARAIATLNHPNICQIYDVGPDYLVMEYVEGTPVMPVDTSRKLLDIAVQLAEGLAAAHAAGIVHRDLKPDNILITRDSRIKILDFGLAKTTESGVSEGTPEDATRTIGVELTDPGTTVGTIAYMSPEQARGSANLTAQSDQFSLGLVLYELAAGKRAFQRGSKAETMTAIIREDAQPLPPTVPVLLRWIVERLLSKEPTDRYDSTRDLYRELRQVRDRLAEATTSGTAQAISVPQQSRTWTKGRVPAIVVAVALLASAITWVVRPVAGTGKQTFTPMEVSLENPATAVWSPDGKAFAYSVGPAGYRRVVVRYLNSPTARPLTGTSLRWSPIGWSPDSKRVIAILGNPRGTNPANAIFAVPVFGGDPDMITALDSAGYSGTVSADGKAMALTHFDADRLVTVHTASPVGSALKRYTPAPFETRGVVNNPNLRFSPDGKSILFFRDMPGEKQVWSLPYPIGQRTPQRILSGALPAIGGTPQLSWLPDGRHGVLSFREDQYQPEHLWIVGLRTGVRRQITGGTSNETYPAVSPDGKKIIFVQAKTDYMIASASLSDATVERVISSDMATGMPSWAAHQEKFAYESDRNGSPAIWMRADGWDRPIVTEAAFPPGATTWFTNPALSPGADRVAYSRIDAGLRDALWISSLSGGPPVRLTNAQDVSEFGGSWSPDGRQFVYSQERNGISSMMLVKSSGEATPSILRDRIAGGKLPEWSTDGQWIKFLDGPGGGGWTLISPDGKTVRAYGGPNTIEMTFSPDSTHLYGIRSDGDHRYLFSLDIATEEEKTIGDIGLDFTPRSYLNPGTRLSLSPDGKHILFPAYRTSNSLWMLEGFDPPTWAAKLREMLPW